MRGKTEIDTFFLEQIKQSIYIDAVLKLKLIYSRRLSYLLFDKYSDTAMFVLTLNFVKKTKFVSVFAQSMHWSMESLPKL